MNQIRSSRQILSEPLPHRDTNQMSAPALGLKEKISSISERDAVAKLNGWIQDASNKKERSVDYCCQTEGEPNTVWATCVVRGNVFFVKDTKLECKWTQDIHSITLSFSQPYIYMSSPDNLDAIVAGPESGFFKTHSQDGEEMFAQGTPDSVSVVRAGTSVSLRDAHCIDVCGDWGGDDLSGVFEHDLLRFCFGDVPVFVREGHPLAEQWKARMAKVSSS